MSHSQPRKDPFADIPTLKITAPMSGHAPNRTDEWCFSYISQSAAGRVNKSNPLVRSFCIRKVFLHEVRNVLSSKKHDNIGPDGRAQYPLPPVGQPAHRSRHSGKPDGTENAHQLPTSYWKEGWYLWMGKSNVSLINKIVTMRMDLKEEHDYAMKEENLRQQWLVHQKRAKQGAPDPPAMQIITYPETIDSSVLKPIQLELPPIFYRMNRTLEKSRSALNLTHQAVKSGDIFVIIKDKAFSRDPFIAAKKVLSIVYERWKDHLFPDNTKEESKDPKKGSKA
ncbi:hypothetical protein BDQ17DRAFT_1537325 [Cyathus striatus]|nr:hypothetical protein BDQ17DRAFT_1537325 [Cyathus striatus]